MDYKTFLDGVQMYNDLNEFQRDYVHLILEPREVWENLDSITNKNVETIAIEFLRRWKIRNTQRIDREELHKTLRNLDQYSRLLRYKRLSNLDFAQEVSEVDGNVSKLVKKMYDKISNVYGVGATSTSKILHGINPSIFMMWDKKERLGYGCAENGVGYLRFLFESKIILAKIVESYQEKYNCKSEIAEERIIKQANTKRKMSLTKLLDQYNFMKFTRERNIPDPHNEIFHICLETCIHARVSRMSKFFKLHQ